jgi:2-amino-4-ketopentanoate thiolase alpha subunit
MADVERCVAGDWVEVEYVLLEPADRAANLPPETASKPLLVWIKGFACSESPMGEQVTVTTMTGRSVTGKLTDVNPGYFHTFGRPMPELVHVGADLRARLDAYHEGGELL